MKLIFEVFKKRGGLGPTKDDVTKQTLCEYFDDELILSQKVLDDIKEYFDLRKRGQMPQSIIFSIKKASEVLKTEPTLCALRTLSSTIMIGTFFLFLNSSKLSLFSSLFFNLRIF